jgi:hypothetical protein
MYDTSLDYRILQLTKGSIEFQYSKGAFIIYLEGGYGGLEGGHTFYPVTFRGG